MIGKCLCGEVQFLIEGKVPNYFQCHCSLCRQVTGTSSNTGTFIRKNNLKWLSGENSITKYSHDTGYRSHFCSICGSPSPNILKDAETYWVPAGLFENDDESVIAVHIYTRSKANWDTICGQGIQYSERPEIETLNKALQRTSR